MPGNVEPDQSRDLGEVESKDSVCCKMEAGVRSPILL